MYGAAHVVLHETSGDRVLRPLVDTNGQEIFPDQTILSATGIINYGGIQELPFYALRQEARSISSLSILPSIQFFTRHHVPPYFMSEGGDLGLREALALPRDERRKRLKALAPAEELKVAYQTRGTNGAVYEDLYFLNHIIDDREEDHRVTSALDTFLDEQADMAKTI